MLLLPYTSKKKRFFTEGPKTYFRVRKDGQFVPNSLRKSDFYARVAHSVLMSSAHKMEIQKKIYKKNIGLLAIGAGGSSHRGADARGSARRELGGGGIGCRGANGGGSGCRRPPPAITGPVPADPAIKGPVAAD